MGKGADRLRPRQNDDDIYLEETTVIDPADNDVEHTRAEMSETIDAIQERLDPERLTDEARDVATEVTEEARVAVNDAIEKIKEAFPELTEQAEQTARDVIDHALQEAKSSLPVLTDQAQETVDHIVDHAIQEAKAALRELGTQARASVRDATIGKVERMADSTSQNTKSFSSSVVTTIKQNPGPAALAALGIGWLAMSGSGGQSQGTKTQTSGSTGSGMTDSIQSKAGDMQGAASDMAGQAQDAVTSTTDDVLHTASNAADQVQETAGNAVDQVQNAAGTAANQVQETAGQLTDQVQNLPARLKQMINTNPVPMGLAAVALGSVAALVVPETQREQEILGSARDKLFDQAQTKAQDVVEKVKNVAEEAGDAAQKEAKYQGLTPEDA